MSFRDDNGSGYGTGQNGFGGGGYNGGVGGGMGGGVGGSQGGGGARNGGFGSKTGLTTGTSFSGKQTGMPGGISEQLAALFRQSQPPRAAVGVSAPVRRVGMAPPPPPPAVAPPKYPVGTLAKSMWDNIFNGPTAPTPVSGVPDEVVPGFGTTYTPPANVSLPTPPGVKAIYDRVPQEPNFPGNKFDQNTGQVGRGKQYSDRVPQSDPFGKK